MTQIRAPRTTADNGWTHFRTDEHYHTTIATDGTHVTVKYSHA